MRALLFLLAVPFLLSSQTAQAEVRRPGIAYRVDSSMADIAAPQQHTSNLIYLNRCEGGCTVYPGYDDSRTNSSSVVAGTHGQTAFISEFRHGDEAWNEIVECVKEVYEPFGIDITDADPGNVPHFEAIVAGRDNEISTEAGGIAPASCGVVNNAITFSFANQGNLDSMCWIVAQETAHAFGLDHEMLCSDPLTYLTGCGYDKTFQDEDAPCGEYEARSCACGGSTQNSYRALLEHFGTGEKTPPSIEINRPKNGALVKPRFPFEVGTVDDVRVASVEFFLNGRLISTLDSAPWVINAPEGLVGTVELQARSTDNRGTSSEMASATVTIKEPEPLAVVGEVCKISEDCESSMCASDGAGSSVCTMSCDMGMDLCPGNTTCTPAGEQNVCWAASESTGGMCNTSGPSSLLSGLFLLLLLGYFRRRDPESH